MNDNNELRDRVEALERKLSELTIAHNNSVVWNTEQDQRLSALEPPTESVPAEAPPQHALVSSSPPTTLVGALENILLWAPFTPEDPLGVRAMLNKIADWCDGHDAYGVLVTFGSLAESLREESEK
jgi:hypothetical protein